MATYFFHLRDGCDILLDNDGKDFADLSGIAIDAMRTARSIISHDAIEGMINLDQRIEVEDAAHHLVHRLAFEDAVQVVRPAIGRT